MTELSFNIGFCSKHSAVCNGFFIDSETLITRVDAPSEKKKGLFTLTSMSKYEDKKVYFKTKEDMLNYVHNNKKIKDYVTEMSGFNVEGVF